MNVLVLGYGMAGARVAAEIRARRDDVAVTVLGDEPHGAYNRVLLSGLLAGRTADVMLRATPGVDVRAGVTATAICRARRVVTTGDGDEVGFDRLVLATGARPVLPPVKGLVLDDGTLPDRVLAFRTLDDCRRIAAFAGTARRVVVLGGGLLGVEAARGLAARGLTVTLLHAAGHLLDRQLDPPAGRILADTLRALGVDARMPVTTARVRAGDDGVTVTPVDGGPVDADLLVVACGVRPDTALAVAAGLDVDRGVVVTDQLATSDPAIYAIGDCAQHRGVCGGLVAPAWVQAAVVADVLTGTAPLARYRATPPVTRLKAAGVDLAAMGDVTDVEDADEITFADPARGTYAKLVVREDRLVGAIMLGDNPAVGTVIQMFDRGARVPPDVRSLLLGRVPAGTVGGVGGADRTGTATEPNPALMPDAAVVCRCNTVPKSAIVAGFRAGDATVAAVAARTRATTGCGSCHDAVASILQSLSRSEEVTG